MVLVVGIWTGIKKNNLPTNLKWGTYAENEADKKRHGTAAIGSRQGSAKLTDEAVRIIRASIPYGFWNAGDAAKVFGVDRSTIGRIVRGKNWKHVNECKGMKTCICGQDEGTNPDCERCDLIKEIKRLKALLKGKV